MRCHLEILKDVIFANELLSSEYLMAKPLNYIDCSQCKKRIEIFSVLSAEELNALNEKRFEIQFNAGETMIKQGTSFTHIVCILDGLVKVYLESDDKKNLILSLIRPGEMIGSPGLFTDEKHHFSVTAVEDTITCFLERQVVEEIIKNNPLFAREMIKRANLREMANFRKLTTLSRKQMPGRIAEMLLYLSKHVYKSNKIYLTVSRQEMSDMACITKESTIRILKEFKDAGLITLSGNDLQILNEKALVNISENG